MIGSYEEIYQQNLLSIEKALTTSNTAAIPTFLPGMITSIANYKNPLRTNLQRKSQAAGKVYIVTRASGGTADWLADGTDPSDRTGAPADVEFTFRIIGARIKITEFRRKQSGGEGVGINLFVDEITRKIKDIANKEDAAYVVGGGTNGPDGLLTLIENTLLGGSDQTVLMGTCTSGTTLTLKKIDETFDKCVSQYGADMMIMPLAIRREFYTLLQAKQEYIATGETQKGGFMLMMYNGAYVYPSTNMSITQAYNGTCEGAETGGTTGSIYLGNSDEFFIGILAGKDMSVTPTNLGTTIWESADIKCFETTVMDNKRDWAKLIGIGYS